MLRSSNAQNAVRRVSADDPGATRHRQGSGRLGNGWFDAPLLDPES